MDDKAPPAVNRSQRMRLAPYSLTEYNSHNGDLVEPRFNLWLEVDGAVALSAWRVALLEAVAETGSITAAAERMNIGYRQAWAKLRECEERLGVPLVETTVGGSGGGGAQLTPAADDLLARYHAFSAGLDEIVEQRFRSVFGPQG